jgi:hypothetical protein
MDRVIRDAAIITMAKLYKEQEIQAYEFLAKYSETDMESFQYYRDLLTCLDLIHETYKPISQWDKRWDLDNQGEYVWVWS